MLEKQGAIHSPLVFQEEVLQIMVSHEPSVFLNEDGSESFVMDVDMLCQFADESILKHA